MPASGAAETKKLIFLSLFYIDIEETLFLLLFSIVSGTKNKQSKTKTKQKKLDVDTRNDNRTSRSKTASPLFNPVLNCLACTAATVAAATAHAYIPV